MRMHVEPSIASFERLLERWRLRLEFLLRHAWWGRGRWRWGKREPRWRASQRGWRWRRSRKRRYLGTGSGRTCDAWCERHAKSTGWAVQHQVARLNWNTKFILVLDRGAHSNSTEKNKIENKRKTIIFHTEKSQNKIRERQACAKLCLPFSDYSNSEFSKCVLNSN